MTAKRILKACARAFLYFAIYFGWQVIVSNWASIAVSVYVMSQTDPSVFLEDIYAYTAIRNDIYNLLLQHTMEITLVSGILTLITVYVIFRVRHKQPLAEVGIHKIPLSHAVLCVIGGMAFNVFTSFAMSVIPFPESWMNSYMDSTAVLTEAEPVMMLLITVIFAPIVEEVTFRGLIYTRLAKALPMFAAMLLSSWIFGVVHGNLIWFLYASLLGLVLCYVSIKTGSLLGSILLHAAFNGTSLILETVSEKMSGTTDITDVAVGMTAVSGEDTVVLLISGIVAAVCLWRITATSDKKIGFFTVPSEENADCDTTDHVK